MAPDSRQHLSDITTMWTVLRQAQGAAGAAQRAQELILQRYSARSTATSSRR
jgi:hypothetical protein